MKFSIYDILSNLIPGFLILFSLFFLLDDSLKDLDLATVLFLAYIVGYLNNTLSSWCEELFYLSWGGKPSDQLIEGKSIWKVKFYENKKAKEYLIKEANTESPSNDNLFQIALRYASSNEKVKDFNSNYALSRNLIISFISSIALMNIKYWFSYGILITSIILVLIIWLRAKQRGFYFAREVLTVYIGIKDKENQAK
ncbi:MAG: hypothetical protein WA440_05965 [Ignavibacteriaceae bacterium]